MSNCAECISATDCIACDATFLLTDNTDPTADTCTSCSMSQCN